MGGRFSIAALGPWAHVASYGSATHWGHRVGIERILAACSTIANVMIVQDDELPMRSAWCSRLSWSTG